MTGNKHRILIALSVVLAIQVLLTLIGGKLLFNSHEADMIHLSDMVLRMASGAVAHMDFATPIGGWAMLPMALLMRAGLGLGEAMIWSQIIVLLALFPALLWVALSRLTPGQSMAFGLAVAGLASGHVSGGTEPLLSFSMHYNRWCWAASLIVAAIALMPPKAGGEVADGAATGLLMAAMAMVKVTFPLSLALPVVFALLRSGRSRTLIVALASALALLAAVTLAEGIGYWTAYAGDLLTVTGSETRAMPSDHWQALILSPVATPATLCMAALIWLLRRGGDSGRAAALMLFYPAFVFISWQNFGNDLIWLCVVALLAWQVWTATGQGAARLIALAAGVLILPVMLNILYSPLRAATAPRDAFRPMFAGEPGLLIVTKRGETAWTRTASIPAPDAEPTVFRGETLPDCELTTGIVPAMERDAAALTRIAPEMTVQPFVAGVFAAHWMFGPLVPLPGGTPWYYSGLPGIDNATHLLVPACPADLRARARVLALVEEAEIGLEPAGETPDFRLYAIRH